jgi:hypothetical protein
VAHSQIGKTVSSSILATLASQGVVIGKKPGNDGRHMTPYLLQAMRERSFDSSKPVLIRAPGAMRQARRQDSSSATLNERPNRCYVVKIDVPDGIIEDEVAGQSQSIFQRHFHKNCLRHSQRFIKQLSRMFHVFDYVAENRKVELPVSKTSCIAIKQLEINSSQAFLSSLFQRGGGDFQTRKPESKSKERQAFDQGAISATDLHDVFMC